MTPYLEPLPYAKTDLAPWISAQTVEFHYEKHHRGYAEKLAMLLRNTPAASLPLEQILLLSKGLQFEAAAQAWNHNFYWKSLRRESRDGFEAIVTRDFGGFPALRERMIDAAVNHFGSGYVWLYRDRPAASDARLILETMHDADNPLLRDATPILCVDLWEHAYYLDYQNRRADYVAAVFDHLLNWRFAEDNWRKSEPAAR